MDQISTVVFYLDSHGVVQAILFEDEPGAVLAPALAQAEALRRAGMRHVCISSENPDSVGKPGVSAVEGGKTPDGRHYGWTKRRRR